MSYQVNRQSPTKSPKKSFIASSQNQNDNMRYSISGSKRYSPGSNIKKSFMNTTEERNLKQSVDEIEFYRQRCHELEQHIHKLEQVLLAQQDGLRNGEFERLQKQFAQKRNEAELWKQKYENTCAQLMSVKSNYELEVQQLSLEVQRLLARLDDSQHDNKNQVEQARLLLERNQQLQLDNVKKTHYQQKDIMEQQNKSLRDQIDIKDDQINELFRKLDRLSNEYDNEVQRVQHDNELLRQRLTQAELERQRELEQVRIRMDNFNQSTIENLRKTHLNSIDVLEGEIEKLRSLLDIKNTEIETLIQSNIKSKQNFDTQLNELRSEVDGFKEKLLEKEHYHHQDLQKLQNQMQDEQDELAQEIKQNYEQSIENLEHEIQNLHQVIGNKNDELFTLARDRQQERQSLNDIISQLRQENEEIKRQRINLEREWTRQNEIAEQEVNRLKEYLEESNQMQIRIQMLEAELLRDKDTIQQKSRENEINLNQKKQLEDELRDAHSEYDVLLVKLQELEKLKGIDQEEFKVRIHQHELQNKDKLRQQDTKIEQLNLDNKRLREQLDIIQYDHQCAIQTKNILERDCDRLKAENDEQKNRIINTERDKVKELEDLRLKLESSSIYQIENLKTAFNTQMNILNGDNQDLKQIAEIKQKEIDELFNKYQSLEAALSRGEYGPQFIANRSIYDVYYRSKARLSSSNKKQQ